MMMNMPENVEFWMTENGEKKSFWVDKDRLFVMGMKTYPEIIDITEMSESASHVLYELLTGSRRFSAHVTMNQAAEILHVATELKFQNLLKIMEKDLIGQTSFSMEQAVDSLSVALEFGMKEAVGKLVDEIVFGFLDEHLLMYCKSQKALEMVMNRKSDLTAEAPPTTPSDFQNQNTLPVQYPQQVVIPQVQQNVQMHKVILTAAREKVRTIFSRPINSFRNGIAWVSRKRQAQQPNRRNDEFEDFLDFDHMQ